MSSTDLQTADVISIVIKATASALRRYGSLRYLCRDLHFVVGIACTDAISLISRENVFVMFHNRPFFQEVKSFRCLGRVVFSIRLLLFRKSSIFFITLLRFFLLTGLLPINSNHFIQIVTAFCRRKYREKNYLQCLR